jgi:hypothetical protein
MANMPNNALVPIAHTLARVGFRAVGAAAQRER